MVVFTCGNCGKSLKKNQVEVHTYKCRGCQYVTCIDCSKDFWGNDYASHTTCLTENEKYGGSNYVPKELKGQKKQEAWIMQVQKSIAEAQNMNPQLKSLLDNLLKFDNLPRKRAKFMNFLRSNNLKNQRLNEDAWIFFEEVKNKNQPSTVSSKPEPCEPSSTEVSQVETIEEPPHKSKRERKEERRKQQTKIQKKDKRKKVVDEETQEAEKPKKKRRKNREEEETNQENEEPVEGLNESVNDESMEEVHDNKKSSPFKWKKAISTVLQDAPEEGMKVKKLKRKILALYVESKGLDAASHTKSVIEIDALIQKKLSRRNDKYVVLKDRVKLRQ